jgi:hypothetical protein
MARTDHYNLAHPQNQPHHDEAVDALEALLPQIQRPVGQPAG